MLPHTGLSPQDPTVQPFAYCVDSFGEARMDKELSVLQQWLWLYLEMRVVLVCPDLVADLRRAIWLLQARALVRTLARAFSSCTVTAPPATAPPVRVTLAELTAAIVGGEACGASGRVELAALRWAQEQARATLFAAGAFLTQHGLAQDANNSLEEALAHYEKVSRVTQPSIARIEVMRSQWGR
jgi:hypothetical protein